MKPRLRTKNQNPLTQIIHFTASVIISSPGHTTGQWLNISSYESALCVVSWHFKALCACAAAHCCFRKYNRRIKWNAIFGAQQSESFSEFLSASSTHCSILLLLFNLFMSLCGSEVQSLGCIIMKYEIIIMLSYFFIYSLHEEAPHHINIRLFLVSYNHHLSTDSTHRHIL